MSSEPDDSPESLEREFDRRLKDWQPELSGTLLFVVSHGRVLLIHKKRGHGAGKINAPGGKIEKAETALACAVRETFEEVGITALAPRLLGTFKFVDRVASQWLGYAFVANGYEGTPTESAEALPEWFEFAAIPYATMWEDDRFWLPEVLAGREVAGEFLFDDGVLLTHRLRRLNLDSSESEEFLSD